ncbi:MAG: hypothetical protein ACI9HK_001586 [Pirellulaceae bacterium]|jgi:hypothetical protein
MPITADTWLELTQRATLRMPLPKTAVKVCFFSTDGLLFRTNRRLQLGEKLVVSFGGQGRQARVDNIAVDVGSYLASAQWYDAKCA